MNTQQRPVVEEPSPRLPAPLAAPRPRSVTFRAVLLGLLLMPVNAYWIVMMENIRYSAHPTTISLFFNCIFLLVVLTGINGLVARALPRFAFSQGELLLVYAMLCIGSCMAGQDFAQILIPNLSYPFAQSTVGNGYQPLFGQYLPRWAMAPGVDAHSAFYLGHGSLYRGNALRLWAQPVLVWTGFVLVLLWTMQCVNVLPRKQWIDNERLSYPLTKIPLVITDAQPFGRGRSSHPLTKTPLFWAGFGLAAGLDVLNALHYYFPGVPAVLMSNTVDLGLSFPTKPWQAIGWTPLTFYPFLIGLGLLMPLDFLFSSWFFIWSGSCSRWSSWRMPGTPTRACPMPIIRRWEHTCSSLPRRCGWRGATSSRCHPMPFQLEAFKMAEQTGSGREIGREMRGCCWVLLLAGGFGMLCACWALLHNQYIYGVKWQDPSVWSRYAGWLKAPKPLNMTALEASVFGFLFAAFLQAMRVAFSGSRFTRWRMRSAARGK